MGGVFNGVWLWLFGIFLLKYAESCFIFGCLYGFLGFLGFILGLSVFCGGRRVCWLIGFVFSGVGVGFAVSLWPRATVLVFVVDGLLVGGVVGRLFSCMVGWLGGMCLCSSLVGSRVGVIIVCGFRLFSGLLLVGCVVCWVVGV